MRDIRRHSILVFLFAFGYCLAGCLLAVSIPDYAYQHCQATKLQVGILGTVSMLAYTAGVFTLGRHVDRWKVRALLTWACLLFAVSIALLPLCRAFWEVLLIGVCWNVAGVLFWPAFMGWMSSLPDAESLPRVLMVFNIAWCAGQFVGDYLSGELYGWGNAVPFIAAAAVSCLLLLVAWTVPRRTWDRPGQPGAAPASPTVDEPPHPFSPLYRWIGWSANFISCLAIFSVRALFPPQAADLHYTPRLAGFLLALMPVTQALLFWLLGRWHGWRYRLWPIIALELLAAASCLLAAPAVGAVGYAVCFLCLGLAIGLGYTSSLYYSVQGREDKGRQASLHEGIGGIGGFIGPALLGAAFTVWGPRAPYIGSTAFFLILIVFQAALFIVWRRCHGTAEKAARPVIAGT